MEKLRYAGYNERRCISRDVNGYYGTIQAVGTYRIEQPTALRSAKEAIILALKQCIVKHPILATAVQDAETEKPWFARVPTNDLTKHLIFRESLDDQTSNLQDFIEAVHQEPLDEYSSRPQWRLYVQPLAIDSASASHADVYHISFACSHVMTDGMSTIIFHRSFLEALNRSDTLALDAELTWRVPSESNLLPAIEQTGPLPVSWSFFLNTLAQEFLPSWIASKLGYQSKMGVWCGASSRPPRPAPGQLLETAARLVRTSPATLNSVLVVCRQHHSRLTALLNVLIAYSLAQALKVRGREHFKFVAATPYDLRRCIPEAREQMANYPSSTNEWLKIDASNLDGPMQIHDWEISRINTERLSKVASTLSDQGVALLKYVGDVRKWVTSQATNPPGASFSQSNIGVFDQDHRAKGPWTVQDFVFSQSADATGLPLNINVASVKGGALNIVVTWWPGMLGVEDEVSFVEDVCASISSRLERIATGKSG